MSNISSAREFVDATVSVGPATIGPAAVGPAAVGPVSTLASPSITATVPLITAAPGTRRAVIRPRRNRPRVVVVESAHAQGTDRLDDELEVLVRLPPPLTAERVSEVLATHRPTAMLWKHSLDHIDESMLAVCRANGVEVFVLAHPVYGLLRPARIRRYGGLPWLHLRWRSGPATGGWAKRGLDLSLTLMSAPLSVPLMVLIMLAVSCSGPPLYLQHRVGAGGRPFRMVKFRTMRVNAEHASGPTLATADDARVTQVGRVLRRLRLDELPQLLNVVCGQMSLVGPRPERPEFVAELRRLPDYDRRHLIRPGITGIAQLTGGYAATAEEKLRCDLLYLHCGSVRFDLTVLMLTVVELFRGFPRG